jgi:hypothetical protein
MSRSPLNRVAVEPDAGSGPAILAPRRRGVRHGGIRPETNAETLSGLDGRSAEKRFMRREREKLLAEIAAPTQAQRAMVEQAVNLALRIHLMDLRFLANGGMTEHDSRTYLAWSNSYTRTLRALGLMSVKAPPAGSDAWQRLAARRNQAA